LRLSFARRSNDGGMIAITPSLLSVMQMPGVGRRITYRVVIITMLLLYRREGRARWGDV
jgi:hypothetical protein